jgi:uncharacterized protein YigA (DUF484 family)
MGTLIQFEEQAVASLRRKLGAAESANADLIAFARGHSGTVAAIHGAVLMAIQADSFAELLACVTNDWPTVLGIDSVALALDVGGKGFRADLHGVRKLEAAMVLQAIPLAEPVAIETVGRGHPLFGQDAAALRGQALVAIDSQEVRGVLLLGQRSPAPMGDRHGAQLLEFLGASLAAIIRRWTLNG